MEKNNFLNFALKVLEDTKKPMSSTEIWEYGLSKGYDKELNSYGKTPWDTLGAQLYTSKKSKIYFDKIGARPIRFVLKKYSNNVDLELLQEQQYKKELKDSKFTYLELELHPLLVYFVANKLNIHAKTINHHNSTKKEFGEWMHPDIVGCFFPFENWENDVYDLNLKVSNAPIKLFSFELKRDLNFSNLRKYFFQTVSNSSWANEGYLVVSEIDYSEEFQTELKRLSTSYGIGVIVLNVKDPNSTYILYPAKTKDNLDWDTIDKISRLNKNFKEFIQCLNDSMAIKKVQEKCFDKVHNCEDIVL